MPGRLQQSIAAYFAATKTHDIAAMLAPFAEEAVVKDEGREYRGIDAIRDWMEETTRKYRFTVDVTDVAKARGKTVVTGLGSGNLPGSPVSLRHEVTVDRRKIARLEIV